MIETVTKVSCMCCVWDAFTAIGTIGATVLALIPFIKENWRRLWIKINYASVTPISYIFDGSKDDIVRNLCLQIINRQQFDIGMQMAYVKIYKKRKHFFAKRGLPLRICFGTRERHPSNMIIKNETNMYFLKYNNDCLMESEQELREVGIPDVADIQKICIDLHTTVNIFHFKVPRKCIQSITAGLSNYAFPECKNGF